MWKKIDNRPNREKFDLSGLEKIKVLTEKVNKLLKIYPSELSN